MNIIRTFFSSRENLYSLIIVGVVGILAWVQHISGTSLMGWDHLQTELHPWLAIKRAYFSLWQEYQSFGLLAGMAHGSDLIRAILVGLLSLVIPVGGVQYAQFMLLLAVGGLGMLRFLRLHLGTKSAHFLPLLGSLFYMFNFGTIQIFHMPFEPFSYFFASLPWLMYVAHRYVFGTSHTGKALFWVGLINFLATPSYYIQTLFVVYMVVLGLYIAGGLVSRKIIGRFRKAFILGCVIGVVNAFWLIPQVYFVAQHTNVVMHAKINQLATADVSAQNTEAGTLSNLFTLRGYYSTLEDSQSVPLFQSWIEYFGGIWGQIGLFGLAGIVIIGILAPDSRKKYFIGPFVFLSILLLSNTPIVTDLYELLMRNPLIHQMFRSPFTKLIVALSFIMSYFFMKGADVILRHISYVRFASGAIIALTLLTALPAFRGEFFARDMQVQIPQEYLDTIEYFKTVDPNHRIALLPDATFWGWFYTDWGYNGSGFLWYGIEQPIISRTFDVWSESSESYFWEMKTALESERIADVEAVLDKYAADYLILDRTLRPVSSGFKALQYDRLQAMLAKSARITQFGFGTQIALYRFDRPAHSPEGGFVQLAGSLTSVAPSSAYLPADDAYRTLGMYRSPAPQEAPDTIYPFRNLTSATRLFDDQWALSETPDSFIALGRIPGDAPLKDYTLVTPPADEAPTSIELYIDGKPQIFTTAPSYELDPVARTVTVTIPKALIRSTDPTTALIYPCQQEPSPLDPSKDTRVQITRGDHLLRVSSTDRAIPCLGYDLPDLDQKFGYLMKLTSANIDGRPFFMAINDSTKQQPVIEDRLTPLQGLKGAPTDTYNSLLYLIPPRFEYGSGYTLTLQNTSYRDIPSTNVLSQLEVYAFPYQTLARLQLVHRDYTDTPTPQVPTLTRELHTTKRAYHAYTVDVTHTGLREAQYVVLNQSYHPGWKAYIVPRDGYSQYIPWLVGRRLPDADHVRINTWAQGWKLPETCEKTRGDCRIVLLFPMQYAVPVSLFSTVTLLIILYTNARRTKNN